MSKTHNSKDQELIDMARSLVKPRTLSRNVEAGKVGSAIITKDGSFYTGINIESDCDLGACAEHVAIGAMITAGEQDIETIVAVNKDGKVITPCGRCREYIYQVSGKNNKTRVLLRHGEVMTIEELLPIHWKTEIQNV